jgi:hypothetical protein
MWPNREDGQTEGSMSINLSSTGGLLKEFFDTDLSKGWNINFIKEPQLGPLTYPAVLLIIAVLAFIIALLYYRSSGKFFKRRSVVKASLISFTVVGALFALRMDLNWLAMFRHDLGLYRGKDVGARIVALTGRDMYYFVDFVRKNIPEGEMAREIEIDRKESAHFMSRKVKYYLLPTRTSISGRYLWANEFTRGAYDAETLELSVYDSRFKAVPHATYDESSLVFRIMEE